MVLKILDALETLYHNEANPPVLGHSEPLDGLVLTILSQNTNDKNRDKAFENLKALFPTWAQVAKADVSRLEGLIRVAGLSRTKSAFIIAILEILHRDFGVYSLKPLAERENMRDYLLRLPGVGVKTAACVMLFEFGRKAFPVDTHIARIARRTQIVNENAKPEEISEFLENIVPLERCLGGHVNLIQHGRTVCHSRKPACQSCILKEAGLCSTCS